MQFLVEKRSSSGLGFCSFKGGSSVVVALLFYVFSHCFRGFCVGMHYFVSFLVLQSF